MYLHIAAYYAHVIATLRAEGKPIPREVMVNRLGALLVANLDTAAAARTIAKGVCGGTRRT